MSHKEPSLAPGMTWRDEMGERWESKEGGMYVYGCIHTYVYVCTCICMYVWMDGYVYGKSANYG